MAYSPWIEAKLVYKYFFFLCEQVLTGFGKVTSTWGTLDLNYHRQSQRSRRDASEFAVAATALL